MVPPQIRMNTAACALLLYEEGESMDAATIKMNNEVVRQGAEHMLQQLRTEGLCYRMWVTGTDRGSTVHIRSVGLTPEMRNRIFNVLRGQAVNLDVEEEVPD
jgi:hypothetical protein